MDIQGVAGELSQNRIQMEAGASVQAMAMQNIRDISANLDRLLETANVIRDPNVGSYLDFRA